MSTTVPLYGFGGGGGGGGGAGGTLSVTAPAGVTVTVSKDGKTKTKVTGSDGIAVFKGLASGTWTVTINDGSQIAQKSVVINTDYSMVISFSIIPEFTYTGDYEIVNDNDEPITASNDNWKIRFLTSGTLIFTDLKGAENGIDVFLVGGGGGGKSGNTGGGEYWLYGGGGGGYTLTEKNVTVEAGTPYSIEIGAGGAGGVAIYTAASGDGGSTSAFGKTANGGYGIDASSTSGGNGGSGGSGTVPSAALPLNGGTDGSDGGSYNTYYGGKGQGTTTREFGESEGNLYASGGSAKTYTANGNSGGANTGNGGDGSTKDYNGGSGGSGIVIIRNAREVA